LQVSTAYSSSWI